MFKVFSTMYVNKGICAEMGCGNLCHFGVATELTVPASYHTCKGSVPWPHLRRVSHFHFYENLVAANLGKRFAL